MDNDVTPSPLSALLAAYGADDFLLVGGVFVIVLSSIFILSSSLPDQSAFATFPGENGKIAFVRIVEGNEEIYAINADGSGQARLTNHPSGDTYPDWSPDGTKIAFMSGRPNDYEIYVMNADGSNPTRLTEDPRSDTRPSWSPDGTRIAFVSERDGGLSRIYIVNADGSGLKRLTNSMSPSDGYGDPSWSPDGTKIAFSGGVNSATGIFVMNANDGSDQTLLSTDPRDSDPDWESIMPLPPPADTTAPVITVPEDIVVEDSGKKGGVNR